jgi:uncharacterized protein (TIGR02453 family)
MLQKDTLTFLDDLKLNNDREWFEVNRNRYEAARQDFIRFVSGLIQKIGKWEEGIKKQSAKDCIFRIYRDVRFSKNKDPYKTHFGAWMNSRGRKSESAGYYFHLEPGNTFLAGGVYMPPAAELKAIRQEIDYNLDDFESILNDKDFKKYFGKLGGEKLKTAPKDYPKDHPGIELLKHKDFIVEHQITNEEVLSEDLAEKCEKIFYAMVPMNRFMNEALGLEENGELM